jgi:hypothetical protein
MPRSLPRSVGPVLVPDLSPGATCTGLCLYGHGLGRHEHRCCPAAYELATAVEPGPVPPSQAPSVSIRPRRFVRLAFIIFRRSLWRRNQAGLYEPIARWRARSITDRPRLSVTANPGVRNQMARGSLVGLRIVPEVKLARSWQSTHSETRQRGVVSGGGNLLGSGRLVRSPTLQWAAANACEPVGKRQRSRQFSQPPRWRKSALNCRTVGGSEGWGAHRS